jgi:sigma-B regulation protein RsbU (phosphoserine phosphatase)
MKSYALEWSDRQGKSSLAPIKRLPFHIGRGTENDLVLPHSSVSRRHATITRLADGLAIMDTNSRNGVVVNGKKLAASESRRLEEHDLVLIGNIKLRLAVASLPEIPVLSKSTHTVEYFRLEDWDPIQTLSGVFPAARGGKSSSELARAQQSFLPWQKAIRSLLEEPLPKSYEPVLDSIAEILSFERCLLIIFDDSLPERIRVLARRGAGRSSSGHEASVYVSRDILRRVSQGREAVIVKEGDVHYMPSESFIQSGTGSALCLPLIARGVVTGVIYLDRLPGTRCFAESDIEMLGPIAGLLALKIENWQLFEAHLASELGRRDLEIAVDIQRDFLPCRSARLEGYSTDGFTRPCYHVGGDYFDFFVAGEQLLTFSLGDVSGKGLPSALYMVGVLTTLRAHWEEVLEVERLMAKLEKYVRSTFRSDHFLTAFLGTLERASGRLQFCNAGHFPPLIFDRRGDVRELEGGDPALNIVPVERFQLQEHVLLPGELLVAYTDGLVEADTVHGDAYGKARLIECIRRNLGKHAAAIREAIFAEIDGMAAEEGHKDDMTLIILERREGAR